jgi:hypothetical protein
MADMMYGAPSRFNCARTSPSSAPAVSRPSLGILRQQLDRVDEEYADDTAYEDSTADAVEAATRLFRDLTPAEREALGLRGRTKEQIDADIRAMRDEWDQRLVGNGEPRRNA